MVVIGASVAAVAKMFLHAGYISSGPRPMFDFALPHGAAKVAVELDVAEALRLAGDSGSVAAARIDPGTIGASLPGAAGWTVPLLAAGAFFAALALVYPLVKRANLHGGWTRRRRAAVFLVPLLAPLIVIAIGARLPVPEAPPPEAVIPRAYADPQAATQALLHGLIADGIINLGRPVERLADIRDEVGLPVNKLTEGEAYALKAYGFDGWGRPFRLTVSEERWPAYRVTSAGADGRYDTEDDIGISVRQCDNWNWDTMRHAFFVRKAGAGLVLFFHRWTGHEFKYRDRKLARALTGGTLFDAISIAEGKPASTNTPGWMVDKKLSAVRETCQWFGPDGGSLVLQVFEDRL
jgi:hypothetical protein